MTFASLIAAAKARTCDAGTCRQAVAASPSAWNGRFACPEQIVHRGPGRGRVPRDGLENIAALAVTLDMPLLAATLHHLQMLHQNIIAPGDEGITHRFHLMRHNPKSAALPKTLQALPSRFFVA